MNKVAARYAKALLGLAVEKEVLVRIHQDIVNLAQACTTHPTLLHTLQSPIIKHDKKLVILREVFQQEVHTLTLRFFALVTQKRREAWLPAIAQAFLAQYDEYQGIKKAHVTTTFPLSDELAAQLQQIVQKMTPAKQVELDRHIDPALLGGYVLQVEDKRLDQSLRKQLSVISDQLLVKNY